MSIATSCIIDVAIKHLIPSAHNVRKSTPSKDSHNELVAGIRAVGILNPPTVIASTSPNMYEVIAGKRRLKAIQDLVKEGHFTPDDTIACREITGDAASLEEISLIENTQRQQMHPADEFEAFRKMQKSGSTPEAIALHLGISEKLVHQRLKLSQIAPAIIKAYRNEELDLAAVMAFTIEDDKQRQLEVFEQIKSAGRLYGHVIRRELKGDTQSSTGRLGIFVGRKAYEAAGGSTSHDLFEETVYFNDEKLLTDLALAKLQRAADKLGNDWNWIEITVEEGGQSMDQIRAYDTQDTAPLREQLKIISDTRETLEDELSNSNEDPTPEQEAHLVRLEEKEEEIQAAIDASQAYRPQEMALAGCFVSIRHNGTIEIERGLVRKEDAKNLAELQNPGARHKPAKSKNGGDPEPDGDNTYSQALIADLTTYRLNIAKHYLALNVDAAQNLLIYTLCSRCLEQSYYSSPLELHIKETNPESGLTQPDTGRAFAAFKQRRDELALDWLNIDDKGQRFEAFTALPQDAKFDLMAYCVASALNTNPLNASLNTVAEIVIRGLDIPWHSEFKPDATNYFGRLSKEHLIEHGKMFLDEDWPARVAKRSKKEIANDLEGVFAGEDQTMPADKRAAAVDWVPEGFRTESVA